MRGRLQLDQLRRDPGLVRRSERPTGPLMIDPLPKTPGRPQEVTTKPVQSVNAANVSQRILQLTTTGILSGGTSIILEADPYRRYLEIFNLDGAATVFLGFNAAPTLNFGRPIAPGSAYQPLVVPTSGIYAISSIANVSILILYG